VNRAIGLLAEIVEWCLLHLINMALVDAFGADPKKGQQKNAEAQAIITKVQKTLEMANKSDSLMTQYKELFKAKREGPVLKLTNAPGYQWGATETVMGCLLGSWDILEEAACIVDGKLFQLDSTEKAVISQFCSVLYPMRRIQELSQKTKKPVALSIYMRLTTEFMHRVLNPALPLTIISTIRRNANQVLSTPMPPVVMEQSDDLDECTTEVREKL
jgi:hypothetical protein